MTFLVTGGAGYIGSHMVKHLHSKGYDVVVLDNLSTGHKVLIDNCELINVDITNKDGLKKKMKNRRFKAVFHFAGKSIVRESIDRPYYYYENNVIGTKNLINCLLENDIHYLIYSSSASIFGKTSNIKIDEDFIKRPVNPYGQSKLESEKIIKSFCEAKNLNAACLRYFNAAGAHDSGKIGELRDVETHLIPRIMSSVLYNNHQLAVFGNDYNTPDGTCIRDYIHVSDLVDAHLKSYKNLLSNSGYHEYNLGHQSGYSVLEVISAVENHIDKKINFIFSKRRIGDPDYLIANSRKAFNELKWKTEMSDLQTIIKSAWKWHKYIFEQKL